MHQNKTVIVTGASRGIGKATALKFAQQGANVVVNYRNSAEAANQLVAHINADTAGAAIAVQADVSDKAAVDSMVAEAVSKFGTIHTLVNNAGQIVNPQFWQNVAGDVWQKNLDINLLGPLLCMQAVMPHMDESGASSIINISSVYGAMGSAFVPAYTASKAALNDLTKGLSKTLAPQIRVNAISPGNIDTDMTAAADKAFVDSMVEQTPMKRLGTAEEVANAVVFLASSAASFITGQIIDVDGGFALR